MPTPNKIEAGSTAPEPLKEGDRAPAFALPDPSGATVSSTELLRKGALVVTFYRGVWCPHCQADLKALATTAGEIQACGASLVAIAHQTAPDSNAKFQQQHKIAFPILDDRQGDAAVAFGICWSPAELRAMQEQLTGLNTEQSWLLPMQARYVIDPQGVIVYADINKDYRQRAEPSEILPVLRGLHGGTAS